jgi:hypothetical protein
VDNPGGLNHDLFFSNEITLDFALDGDGFCVDVRLDVPGLADGDLTFFQVNDSLDLTVYRQILFPGNFPFDLHARPDDGLRGLCFGFIFCEGREWSIVTFFFVFSSHESQSNPWLPEFFVTVITKPDLP